MLTLETNVGTEFLQIDRDFLLYVLQTQKMTDYKAFIREIANRRLKSVDFGQLTEKRSQQFYCLSGTAASNWLFRKPKHSETVHCLPQASHPRQASADRAAGQPRAPLYNRSR